MFNPFSRTSTPGFNVRPQDDLPGCRVEPEEQVPGFNIDENGLPRPRPFVDPQSSAQPADDGPLYPQASVSGSGVRPTSAPLPAAPSSADPNFVLATADDDGVQEAQQTRPSTRSTPPPVPPTPPAQTAPATGRRQMPPLKREMSGEDLSQLEERRREEALNEAFLYKPRREERAPYWDYMIRALPIPNRLSTLKSPAFPDSRIQQPLSSDWRADVRKLNPDHLDYTEAAAKKYGIPPELLARLLYRESNYKNQGVDSNGNPLPRRAVGIPQMYPDALKDVGVDPTTFGRAGAAAQIDAGAAYLARQYRRFGDWPRAVAAYHSGADRIDAWLSGKAPTYENIEQRKKGESAYFRGKTGTPMEKKTVEGREKAAEKAAEKTATDEMNQWAELQAYLPYIFLGDPSRYDRPRSP